MSVIFKQKYQIATKCNSMESFDKSGIAGRMREVRKKHNLTQKEIAGVFKLSRSVYSRIEVNNYTPNLDHVIAFGKHYKVDLNWLVFGIKPGTLLATEYDDDYSLSTEDPIERIKVLQKMIDTLESSINDKDTIISYLRKEVEELKQ